MSKDNKSQTLRKYFKTLKEGKELIPDPDFVKNTKKILTNEIELIQGAHKIKDSNQKSSKLSISNFLQKYFFGRKNILTLAATFALIIFVAAYFILGLGLRDNDGRGKLETAKKNKSNPTSITQKPYEAGNYSIKAERASDKGVKKDSDLIIAASNELELAEFKQKVKVTPSVEFNTVEVKEGEYRIEFAEELDPGQIYQVTVENDGVEELAWAFQVEEDFKITNTLLGKDATNVPVDTGIEITFTTEDYNDNYADYITIYPQTEGKFERKGRTLVFIPEESLEHNKNYTVTIQAGYANAAGDSLESTYTFSFVTETKQHDTNSSYFYFQKSVNEFSPTTLPTFELFSNLSEGDKIPVDIYKFRTQDNFVDQVLAQKILNNYYMYSQSNYAFDLSKLDKVTSVDAELMEIPESYFNNVYFSLPEALPAGYYLIRGESQGEITESVIIVSDLSIYSTYTQGDSLVWVNDLVTLDAVVGAEVLIHETTIKTTTNAEGIAVFDTSGFDQGNSPIIKISTPDGRSTVMLFGRSTNHIVEYANYNDIAPGVINDYWSFINTDRPVYLPGDTIQFWGYLRHRDEGQAPVELKAVISEGYYYNRTYLDSSTENIYKEITLKVDENGFYNGEFKLDGLGYGYYQISILDGKTLLDSKSFTIETYVKPSYSISLELDKKAVMEGDTIKVSGQALFYSGAPVALMELEILGGEEIVKVTTDEQGKYESVIKVENEYDYYFPSGQQVTVKPANAEEAEISTSATIYVFNRNFDVSTSTTINNNTYLIDFLASKIHLDLANKTAGTQEFDYTGEGLENAQIQISILRNDWIKEETVEYYDYINKKVVKTYTFKDNYVNEAQIDLTTDVEGKASYFFEPKFEDKAYKVEIFVNKNNQEYNTTLYYYSYARGSNPWEFRNYPENYQLVFDTEKQYYSTEDTVKVEMQNLGYEQNEIKGKYLFEIYRRGLKSYKISDSNAYEIKLDTGFYPNVWVVGHAFTAEGYKATPRKIIELDSSQKEADIKITADKSVYNPGEEVKLDFNVTDRAGRPVQGKLNVKVVDEAYYSLFEDNTNIQDELYAKISSGIYKQYSTHEDISRNEVGGKGSTAGGNTNLRTNFKDIATFALIDTSVEGKASYQFKLTDNLTDWRITVEFISDEANPIWGKNTTNIKSSLPFFVEIISATEFVSGDKPQIKLRAFGTELKEGDNVSYKISSLSLGIEEEVIIGKAFEEVYFTLTSTPEGIHDIKVEALSGSLSDAVEEKIVVIQSRAEFSKISFMTLEEFQKLNDLGDKKFSVTFASAGKDKYLYYLYMLRYSYGERTEQIISRYKAQQLLMNYYKESTDQVYVDASFYQKNDGSIATLPYADGDLELTVRIADIAPELFNEASIASYLQSILDDQEETRERKITALYGLASLHKPVLVQIQNLLQLNDLSLRESLYLATALAKLGNKQESAALYENILAQSFIEKDNYIYMDQSKYDEIAIVERVKIEAQMMRLGGILRSPKATKIHNFLLKERCDEELFLLEESGFLSDYIASLKSEEATIEYSQNGTTVKRKLDPQGLTLTFTKGDYKNFSINSHIGEISVIFNEKVALEQTPRADDLKISRKYLVNGRETKVFNQNDIVEVELSLSIQSGAPAGCYLIQDIIPSGLTMVTPYKYSQYDDYYGVSSSTTYYPYGYGGQIVEYCFFKDSKINLISYLTRVTTSGTFIAEPAMIRSFESPSYQNFTEQESVKIKD